jgi:hypothetical protein
MRLTRWHKLLAFSLTLALPTVAFADYSYQEITQLTGGSMLSLTKMAGALSSQARKAGEPVVSSVYLKGNRLANVSADSVEIIDLDKETITHIDMVKHTYTLMTFQQIKDQAAKAAQQLQNQPAPQPAAAPANPDASNVKMTFDVHVRNTGAVKDVSGVQASEAIMTMNMNATDQTSQQTGTMAITNDMWMVSEIPGYAQLRDFYVRMGAKMDFTRPSAGIDYSKLFAQNPGASVAVADMAKEMQKLKGVPIEQIMRMGTTMNGEALPAASEAPLPPDTTPAMPSAGDVARQSAASAISSRLGIGGLGGFGHKKQPDPPPAAATAPPTGPVVLMEQKTTISGFSSAPVDPSRFEVPAGFKLVQPQI